MGSKGKGVFSKVVESLQSIAHAFVGDVAYGQLMGKEPGATSTVRSPVAMALGAQLKARWLPSFDDEAAFQLALSSLTPAEAVIIAKRVEALGDPKKSDTPEARVFRKIIVTLPDNEQRTRVLSEMAKQDDQGWLKIAKITGAATAGQWTEAIRAMRQRLGIVLPASMTAISTADAKAAERIDAGTGKLRVFNDMLRARRTQRHQTVAPTAPTNEEM